ncbi:MAG: peptidylprolyl isomerase [Marinilabiliales bacterium]
MKIIKIPYIFVLLALFNNIKAQENVIDQIVAVVGKSIILKSEIEKHYLDLQSQGYISSGDLKCDILEELMFQKLLLDQAQLDSVEITSREVDYAMDNRLRQIIAQFGSEEELEKFMGKTILEFREEVRDEVKEQLLIEKMRGKITEDIKVTPSEIKDFYNNIPDDSIPVVDAEYEYQQIVIRPKVSEEEKEKVKEKLKKFRERILNGEKFSTLAILYSEDPGTARKGGELGFISRTDPYAQEFMSVAFNLKEPGEVSRIVETEFGYHIIQLIERRGELINVRHILLIPKVSPEEKLKAKAKLDSILTLIKKDTLTFDEAAEKFSDDENTKLNGGLVVNPNTSETKFKLDELDFTTKYTIKDMEIGDISEPFESVDYNGKTVYKIIRLKNKIDKHKLNLDMDYQLVKNLALSEKKQEAIYDWILKKQQTTYIHIDDSYKNCPFKTGKWVKK